MNGDVYYLNLKIPAFSTGTAEIYIWEPNSVSPGTASCSMMNIEVKDVVAMNMESYIDDCDKDGCDVKLRKMIRFTIDLTPARIL